MSADISDVQLAMDFRKRTVEEVLTWLDKKGYDEWVREVFEGQLFVSRRLVKITGHFSAPRSTYSWPVPSIG